MGRKSRFSAEQSAHALNKSEAGVPIIAVNRNYSVNQQTCDRLRAKLGSPNYSSCRSR